MHGFDDIVLNKVGINFAKSTQMEWLGPYPTKPMACWNSSTSCFDSLNKPPPPSMWFNKLRAFKALSFALSLSLLVDPSSLMS